MDNNSAETVDYYAWLVQFYRGLPALDAQRGYIVRDTCIPRLIKASQEELEKEYIALHQNALINGACINLQNQIEYLFGSHITFWPTLIDFPLRTFNFPPNLAFLESIFKRDHALEARYLNIVLQSLVGHIHRQKFNYEMDKIKVIEKYLSDKEINNHVEVQNR